MCAASLKTHLMSGIRFTIGSKILSQKCLQCIATFIYPSDPWNAWTTVLRQYIHYRNFNDKIIHISNIWHLQLIKHMMRYCDYTWDASFVDFSVIQTVSLILYMSLLSPISPPTSHTPCSWPSLLSAKGLELFKAAIHWICRFVTHYIYFVNKMMR